MKNIVSDLVFTAVCVTCWTNRLNAESADAEHKRTQNKAEKQDNCIVGLGDLVRFVELKKNKE